MNIRCKISIVLCLAVMLFLAGCHKKRPKLPPPQAAPVELPQPLPPEPEPKPQPQPPVTEPTPTPAPEPAPKPKPNVSHKHKPAPSKPSTATTTPAPAPPKPSNDSVQISADLPPGTAQSQRRDTDNLLQMAESNLRRVTRSLNDDEQAMVRQARNYIAQSRTATQDGDYQRAYNLAVKAKLLSAELVK